MLPCFTGFSSSEDFELQQRSKVRVDELCLGTNDLFVVIFWILCFHFKLEGASFSFFLFSPVFMVQQQCKRWFSFLPLVSWTSVSFKAIKLHSCGFNWSEQLAYLNVGKRKTELYFFCENRQILYIENKTYLQIYTANSFLGYELKFRDYIGFEGFDTRWKISLMIENFSQTIIK